MLCVMVIQQYVTVMKDLILPDVINVLLVTMAFLNVLNQVSIFVRIQNLFNFLLIENY